MNFTIDHRERMLRKRAATIGLKVCRRGPVYELHNEGRTSPTSPSSCNSAVRGTLDAVETYVEERYVRGKPGPQSSAGPPAAWAQIIEDYLTTLAAAGQSAPTIRLRRHQLGLMARELGSSPADVTGEQLVAWLGAQSGWALETRRGARSAARSFFLWAYKVRRIPLHIADDLPKIRQRVPAARPAPDQVWREALSAADARTTLILRLAAEAGLRRAEISCVHVRDLTETMDGAQLLVHGKGGKQRVVPISDDLAAAVMSASTGWLFPSAYSDHVTAGHIAKLAQKALPDGWTLHTLRHRFATRAYRGSRNLRAVQVLMGHSSIATTERYLACDDSEIRAAMLSAV